MTNELTDNTEDHHLKTLPYSMVPDWFLMEQFGADEAAELAAAKDKSAFKLADWVLRSFAEYMKANDIVFATARR